jgi:hypothetical protein
LSIYLSNRKGPPLRDQCSVKRSCSTGLSYGLPSIIAGGVPDRRRLRGVGPKLLIRLGMRPIRGVSDMVQCFAAAPAL